MISESNLANESTNRKSGHSCNVSGNDDNSSSCGNITMARQTITMLPLSLLVALLLVLVGASFAPTTGKADQLYKLAPADEGQLLAAAAAVAEASQQANHNAPGHYEFEVAPKMEPPSVRKPPYLQSNLMCPGSDPFAGFSPTDTLCGDLNQGRVPINPLGQSITDQAYPFELIKNKTLQFLARALPVLKLEYETIPKVARYLPANHLLNPTHQTSPLSQDHMQQLNQRFAAENGLTPDELLGTPYLRAQQRKRRRKRQAAVAGITVAEMSPNVTLVFSSAHSASRISSLSPRNESSSPFSSNESATGLTLLTKDGHKPIASAAPHAAAKQRQQQATTTGGGSKHGQVHNHYAWAQSQIGVQQKTGAHSSSSAAATSNGSSSDNLVGKKLGDQGQQSNGSSGNNGDRQGTAAASAGGKQQEQAAAPADLLNSPASQHTHVTLAKEGASKESCAEQQQNSDSVGQGRSNGDVAAATAGSQAQLSAGPSGGAASTASSSGSQQQNSSASSNSAKRRAFSCAESGNGFTATICQAAAALIEGDRPPAWLQLVKHLGNAYSGASDSHSIISSSGSPIWSVLSGLAQEPSISKSSSLAPAHTQSKANLLSVLGPLSSFLSGTSAKDSSSVGDYLSQNKEQHQPQTLASALSSISSSTMTRLALAGWASNAIASLVEYFVPSAFHSASRTFAKRKKPFDPQEIFVDTPASLAAAISKSSAATIGSGLAASKQPPTPCPSIEEYISPTFARNYQGAWKYVVQIPHEGYFTQTIQRTSCVRQKCEFTEGVCHESPRWVSLLVAEIYYPNTIFSANQATGGNMDMQPQQQQLQQLASVGSARNQMATSSSTNSIQQVAMQAAQQQQRQLASKSQLQDPLQMTDSFNTYNHNLNAAFINAANELGLDPNNVANMQQLANAYNYQLMQRNGLLSGQQQQQQQVAESRSSQVNGALAGYTSQGLQAPANQPMTSQQYAQIEAVLMSANGNGSNNQHLGNGDHIAALAAAALQQNPNLNINDLINSMQRRRKKRDLRQYQAAPALTRVAQQRIQYNNQQPFIQQRSSATQLESLPSINDIGTHLPQQLATSTSASHQNGILSHQYKQLQSRPLESQAAVSAAQGSMMLANVPQNSQTLGDNGQQHQQQQQQQQPQQPATGGSDGANQVECDGHDKIGCYVVRVYYDWFLVNGSCKCWKTTGNQTGNSASGNSFLRRIFTG